MPSRRSRSNSKTRHRRRSRSDSKSRSRRREHKSRKDGGMENDRNERDYSKHKKSKNKHRERSKSREHSRSLKRRSPPSFRNENCKKTSSPDSKDQVELPAEKHNKQKKEISPGKKRKSEDSDEDVTINKKKKHVKDKETKLKEKIDVNGEYMGYSNTCNPFGDENLFGTFVWKKKLEAEGRADISLKKIEKEQKKTILKNRTELEQVQKRVQERERAKAARDEERDMMQREKEAAFYDQWQQQEDSFHLQQVKKRSEIRLEDGRAKPIDLLAQYVKEEGNDFVLETEPYNRLIGLTIEDLEDLLEDIETYSEAEQRVHSEYWADVTIVAREELKQLKKLDPNCAEYISDTRSCVHPSVQKEVAKIFKGKTLNQLDLLESEIAKRLNGGEGVDITYWENLAQQLKVFKAKQRLKERYKEQLLEIRNTLQQEQCIERTSEEEQEGAEDDLILSKEPASSDDVANPLEDENCDQEEYLSGRYSPILIKPDDLPLGSIIVDMADDFKRLCFARQQVFASKPLEKIAENEDGADFTDEVVLKEEVYHWSDKYRPRKPRFCNKVHTGFEWNKYNQTHYDIDNPPPRIVQGYKFNIFYPDLIDKTKIPQYQLVPCEDKNFAVIRFMAGPPYEDIAFKVVNREWDHRRGFRCYFQNSTLQLWFSFRRLRYRK